MKTANKKDTVNLKCCESVITCQICMDIFDSPRIFPCQHTFCKDCTISLLKKHCLDEDGNTKKSSFPCPNCRKDCKIRKIGKHSVEEHLKCFPENLLLKTLLDSIPETCEDSGIDNASQTECTRDFEGYGIFEDDKDLEGKIFLRLLFYMLFMDQLQEFLAFVTENYSSSLFRVNQSAFAEFVQRLLRTFEICEDLRLNCSQLFPMKGMLRSLGPVEWTERTVLSNIHCIKQNEFRNILTGNQMDNYVGDSAILEKCCAAILTKNVYPVVRLLFLLFRFEHMFVFNLFTLNVLWPELAGALCGKVFDILYVVNFTGLSFSSCALFNITSYIVLLLSYKKVKRYIGGRFAMDTTLPAFKLFLINLNFFSNVNRWYAYYTVLLKLDFWILAKLALIEVVSDVVCIILLIIYYRVFLGIAAQDTFKLLTGQPLTQNHV